MMETISNAVLSSWELNPWVLIPIAIFGTFYARGWLQLHRRDPARFGFFQLTAFFAGLTTVVCALCSPLDAFAGWLLTVHMIQHLLLMMVAPPLLLYGAPYLPLLFGLPRGFLRDGLQPFLASPTLRNVGHSIVHPVFSLSAFVFTNTAWHLPVMYELALRSPTWHQVEHVCFLTTALLFWWPIIQPYPWVARTQRWLIVPYLFLADIQNTALSAFLIFYERVLYPAYATVPRITSLTPLEDQAAAGAIMWVAGSVVFLVPVGLVTIKLLSTRRTFASRRQATRSQLVRSGRMHSVKQRPSKPAKLDLLSLPFIGRLLRWSQFRRAAQLVMLLLAVLVVLDGLFGHQMAAMNLAGVLPWTHWRALTILALLIAGNIFCFACPFNFARELGRRILPARWSWPRRFRSKWIAISLLLLFFWAYEAFSLWDSPRATAMLVISYFAAAIIVDGLFTGASFCKYVCPIGQYQFIQSLVSPVEVSVRNLAVCGTCHTYDCIRGNEQQRGCELQLFQPRKTSNMDCTLCLDCVHACPHENVSLLASLPGSQLVRIERSKKRRNKFFRRFDVAALVFLLVFAAFANAGGMVLPVQSWEQSLETKFGLTSLQPIIAALYLVALVILPAFLIAGCVWLAKTLGPIPAGWKEIVSTYAPAFVPLGFSMWLIHFSYHLLTAGQTALPVIQRAAMDVGITLLGAPNWSLSSTMPSLDWLPALELMLLDLGLLFTLYIGWRGASRFGLTLSRRLRLNAPWAALAFLLYSIGIWIIFQPMQMRGMMMGSMR
ncbi:MAG TPA: cytochrome c oxidase assembly protein [Pyrinomonadaceae bacterium]|nr:cytochrome c oxidase assembly protein [Pyrinomonadaceae bacterium]